jgi:hypothetical protein
MTGIIDQRSIAEIRAAKEAKRAAQREYMRAYRKANAERFRTYEQNRGTR